MKNLWQEVIVMAIAFLAVFIPAVLVNIPTNHCPDLAFLIVRYGVVPASLGWLCANLVVGFFLDFTGRRSEIFLRGCCDATRTIRRW